MGFKDFYTLSDCRDLIFHVQEHRFNLKQISEILSQLDLDFLGFENLNPVVVQSFQDQFPDNDSFRDLDKWDKFEHMRPAVFASMYLFWLQKPKHASS